MPDQFDRLKAALSDRYEIEREIGQGGMANVYLAEDNLEMGAGLTAIATRQGSTISCFRSTVRWGA